MHQVRTIFIVSLLVAASAVAPRNIGAQTLNADINQLVADAALRLGGRRNSSLA